MKRIKPRPPLSGSSQRKLTNKTRQICRSRTLPNRKAKADALWKKGRNQAPLREAKETLRTMNDGLDRCMYCEFNESSGLDHWEPRALAPARTFDWINLFLACTSCNSNHKRDRFPTDPSGAPLLLNPEADEPAQHLDFDPDTGKYTGLTPRGEASVEVFGLNRFDTGRRDAWATLTDVVLAYDAKTPDERANTRHRLLRYPFRSLFERMVRMAHDDGAAASLAPELASAIRRHELLGWL